MTAPDLAAWAELLLTAARAAGDAILETRRAGFIVEAKADASPVTVADRRAEAVILAALEPLMPQFPVVAEERIAAEGLPVVTGRTFWLVDALDGTREFINGGDEFTVNIGLVEDGLPTVGVVHAPARGESFIGVVGRGAWRVDMASRHAIRVRPRPAQPIILGSKTHEIRPAMEAFLRSYGAAAHRAMSSSIKFCVLAMGEADLYPRFGPTSEWDTAAGHAILRAAGGRVHDFEGSEIQYGKPDYRNGRFLADGGP